MKSVQHEHKRFSTVRAKDGIGAASAGESGADTMERVFEEWASKACRIRGRGVSVAV